MNLKIRIYGDPILREKAKPVKSVGPVERMLISSMIETMRNAKGIGLAAPQIGVSEQILIADIDNGQGAIAVINPEIIKKNGNATKEEGCLSIPGVLVNVKRPLKILVRYLDENNRRVEKEYTDMLARVILHETDHLNGKLIVDYVLGLKKIKLKKVLEDIAQGKFPEAKES